MHCPSLSETRHAPDSHVYIGSSGKVFGVRDIKHRHASTCLSFRGLSLPKASSRVLPTVKAGKDDRKSDDESLEKLLWKELEKRGISGPEQLQESSKASSTSQQARDPAPRFEKDKSRSQLEESRKLNSEGLEGLIPRARQLVSLGVTFFLAFWPFLLAITALFSSIFWLYGEDFIHGGRPSYTRYVEPAELLSEPTVDDRVPFR